MTLPNFLVIGAARSGTTSLYHNLVQHPDIFMPLKKEPQFFTANREKGIHWYQSLFAEAAGQKAIGEASMTYTYPPFSETPSRIAALLPDVQLIYMLRNPVERTYSHYLYYRYNSAVESEDFEEAIRANPIYLGASCYDQWVQRYLDSFPSKNLFVAIFEEYVVDPIATLQQVFRFLCVDDSFVPARATSKTNASFMPRSQNLHRLYRRFSLSGSRMKLEALLPEPARPLARNAVRAVLGTHNNLPVLKAESRSYLEDYFRPSISRLEILLNRSLTIWQSD